LHGLKRASRGAAFTVSAATRPCSRFREHGDDPRHGRAGSGAAARPRAPLRRRSEAAVRPDRASHPLRSDPRLDLKPQRERDYYDGQSETTGTLIRVFATFVTAILSIGAIFGAMNTMYAAVGARTREIAMLLVLGFSPAAVMTSFMIESVFLALLGGVIGCLLALPINGIVTSTTNFSSFSEVAFAFRVTPQGAECFCDVERILFVRD